MSEPTSEQVEAAAEAIFNVWRASPCSPDYVKELTWSQLVAGSADKKLIAEYVETGRAEARAAILAATTPEREG
jgi:hypothetical protein